MPILFNKETKIWELIDLTPEEANSIVEIGKEAIVARKGRDYVEEKLTEFLRKTDKEKMYNA